MVQLTVLQRAGTILLFEQWHCVCSVPTKCGAKWMHVHPAFAFLSVFLCQLSYEFWSKVCLLIMRPSTQAHHSIAAHLVSQTQGVHAQILVFSHHVQLSQLKLFCLSRRRGEYLCEYRLIISYRSECKNHLTSHIDLYVLTCSREQADSRVLR